MHRIDTSSAQVDKFGTGKNGFTGGNPQTGKLPTALDADYFDSVQEEIAGVIEAAGIVLNKSNNSQLLAAIKGLVGSGRLLNVQIFINNGQYTPTPETKKIIVEAISGGGGSRSGTTASGQTGGSTPGYHGQYCKSLFDLSAISAPFTVTVGSGGTAGNYGGATFFGPYISLGGGNPADGTLSASGAGVAGSAYHRTGAQNDSAGKVLATSYGTSLSSPIIQVTAGTACGFSAPNSPFPGGFRGRGADGVYAPAGVSYTGATGIDGMVVVWEYA